jgi:hypothetical protein
MTGIAEWLASIGLGEYAERFRENAIDLSVVRDLTEQVLKDLGVLLGHRRKMLRAIVETSGRGPANEGVTRTKVELAYQECPPVTGLGDAAALDLVNQSSFLRARDPDSHQLARILKAGVNSFRTSTNSAA